LRGFLFFHLQIDPSNAGRSTREFRCRVLMLVVAASGVR
jgi:hypothetical protein